MRRSFSGNAGGAPADRSRVRRAEFALLAICALWLGACGSDSSDARLAAYRERIESDVGGAQVAEAERLEWRLPSRRERRLETTDQRIGPVDFLALFGCPLSEIVAARNNQLGRLLEPTRRLAHELALLAAAEDCLPTLAPDRAACLGELVDLKRAELGAHVWNAVWLDEDLERFLSSAPRALIGGASSGDGPRQLRRAADAIASRDVPRLEAAFAQLRDDPPLAPRLREMMRGIVELDRATALVVEATGSECDPRARRLARTFREGYLPIQGALADLDRDGEENIAALGDLYAASARASDPPEAMRRFQRDVLGTPSHPSLASRFRAAVVAHATAWAPILEQCGVLPTSDGADLGAAGVYGAATSFAAVLRGAS